jgi:hypothetical protein
MSVVVLSSQFNSIGSKLVRRNSEPWNKQKKWIIEKEERRKKKKRIRKHVDNFVPTGLAQKDNNNNNNNNKHNNNNNNNNNMWRQVSLGVEDEIAHILPTNRGNVKVTPHSSMTTLRTLCMFIHESGMHIYRRLRIVHSSTTWHRDEHSSTTARRTHTHTQRTYIHRRPRDGHASNDRWRTFIIDDSEKDIHWQTDRQTEVVYLSTTAGRICIERHRTYVHRRTDDAHSSTTSVAAPARSRAETVVADAVLVWGERERERGREYHADSFRADLIRSDLIRLFCCSSIIGIEGARASIVV